MIIHRLSFFAFLALASPGCALEEDEVASDGEESGEPNVGETELAATAYHWIAAHYNDWGDSDRRFRVLLQLQAKTVDQFTTHVRPYFSVRCTYKGQPYPCGMGTTPWQTEVNDDWYYGSASVSNTGTDGFYSRYGAWKPVDQCSGFVRTRMTEVAMRMAGKSFAPLYTTSKVVQICDL